MSDLTLTMVDGGIQYLRFKYFGDMKSNRKIKRKCMTVSGKKYVYMNTHKSYDWLKSHFYE